MGFGSLQHIKDRRSTCRGFCPPAPFRLQGLVTLVTACSLRSRAGLVSYRQRSWDSPFGGFPSRKVSGVLPLRKDPRTVQPGGVPAAEAPGRPDRPRFPGLDPSESPWRSNKGLARRPLVPPLGSTLPGYLDGSFDRDFARSPPTRFADPTVSRPTDRRPGVSISFRSASSVRRT
jgi:hypothetical protein